jgi:hypothetical protein
MGDYVPSAPVNDEAKKQNQSLPGMGGVFNVMNFHVYHYAGNNPVKYTDPDGKVINLVAAGIGAAIGAGVGAAVAIASGGSARNIAAAAVGGAVTGGMAGLTMGGSLAVQIGAGALAGTAGYMAGSMVEGESYTAQGIVGSAIGGAVGSRLTSIAGSPVAGQSTKITNTARQVANSPDFIVDRSGQTFPVPKGATGPVPSINESGKVTGIGFKGGNGGGNGQVTTMRIMDPRGAIGKAPDYPNGYVKYTNANKQAVDPYTGRTVTPEHGHHPIKD